MLSHKQNQTNKTLDSDYRRLHQQLEHLILPLCKHVYMCQYILQPFQYSLHSAIQTFLLSVLFCFFSPSNRYSQGQPQAEINILSGVYVPCIYSHVRWSYCRRFRSLLLCPLSVERYYFPLIVDCIQQSSSARLNFDD